MDVCINDAENNARLRELKGLPSMFSAIDASQKIIFVLKTRNFALKMKNCVSKTRNCVFKMMTCADLRGGHFSLPGRQTGGVDGEESSEWHYAEAGGAGELC